MPDTTTEIPATGEPVTPAAPAETISKAEHEAAIAALTARHDSQYANLRREMQAKQGKHSKEAEPKPQSDADRLGRVIKQRDALEDALTGKSVTLDQRRTMREHLELKDPDEPGALVESLLAAFGLTTKPESKPGTPDPVTASKPPQSDGGAPQGIPVWERPSDPFKWTEDDVARLVAQKGPREAHKIIRNKAEAYARTIRLSVSPAGRR